MGSGLSGRLGNQRVVTSGTFGAWSPANVPEIAAGYFWLPGDATGLGTAGFTAPEGGGHTTFDQKQATTAKQPTAITVTGQTEWKFVGAVDVPGSDIRMITAAAAQAGWTGATYLAMWHRWPDGLGALPSGNTGLFAHNTTAGNQRRITLFHSGATESYNMLVSADGTTTQTNTWDASPDYAANPTAWVWQEWLFTPGVGVAMYSDFDLRAPLTQAINAASLFDASALLALASFTTTGINQNEHHIGPVYYGNGIPSLQNRQALYRHLAPR